MSQIDDFKSWIRLSIAGSSALSASAAAADAAAASALAATQSAATAAIDAASSSAAANGAPAAAIAASDAAGDATTAQETTASDAADAATAKTDCETWQSGSNSSKLFAANYAASCANGTAGIGPATASNLTNSTTSKQNFPSPHHQAALANGNWFEFEAAILVTAAADGGTAIVGLDVDGFTVAASAAVTLAPGQVFCVGGRMWRWPAGPNSGSLSYWGEDWPNPALTTAGPVLGETPTAAAFDIQPTITFSASGGGNAASLAHLKWRIL